MEGIFRVVGLERASPGNIQLPMQARGHSIQVSIGSEVYEKGGERLGFGEGHSLGASEGAHPVVLL
jgi:hypothetical protein